MKFKDATAAYAKKAVRNRRKLNGILAKPSPSKSHLTRGTWYLRDRQSEMVARVSRRGVRFAGTNEFAR
jgi:hypothetical protein